MSGEDVRRVPDDECDALECWERDGDEPDLRLVDATRVDHYDWPWRVGAAVMEFIRVEPLESELDQAMTAALLGVLGVAAVARQDREVWTVAGSPSGEELVRAAASVVDRYLSRTRVEYESLG